MTHLIHTAAYSFLVGVIVALLFWLYGCTIRIEPLGYKKPVVAHKKHHATTHHRRAASQDSMYVSRAWLEEYHEMEAEHGGYSIADDSKIQHEGDKVKVPRTVLKHFHDLSRTSPPPKDDTQP